MTPKDIEITLVAILKSTIEAQIPRTEWRTSVEHAVHVFQDGSRGLVEGRALDDPQPGGAPIQAPQARVGRGASIPSAVARGLPDDAAQVGRAVFTG